jgi:methionyl-tRNA formyltransferase
MARLVYLGTPDVAVPPLEALVAAGHDVALVVTRPDARRRRRGANEASPVKQAARALGLPVTSDLAEATTVGADFGVVVAYGRIIPADVLGQVPMVNLHFSLLPRWRGAAPVERAILAGDTTTGVCLMAVEEGLDTGGVYRKVTTDIGPEETLEELRSRLVDLGSALLVEGLEQGWGGLGEPQPQVGEVTYAEKLQPGESELDWHLTAEEIARRVRLGRAFTTFRGQRLRILAARPGPASSSAAGEPTTDGPAGASSIPDGSPWSEGVLSRCRVGAGGGTWLELEVVQPEGKRPMPATEWRRGVRLDDGEHLGT